MCDGKARSISRAPRRYLRHGLSPRRRSIRCTNSCATFSPAGRCFQKIVVERGAAKGISLPQLRRARKAISAITFKRRGGNVISPWLWALPEHVPDDVEREDESVPEGDA